MSDGLEEVRERNVDSERGGERETERWRGRERHKTGAGGQWTTRKQDRGEVGRERGSQSEGKREEERLTA